MVTWPTAMPTHRTASARASQIAKAAALLSFAMLVASVSSLACGETRRPIGDECLRNEDCLSSVCAARSCVAAPTLVNGSNNTSNEDDEPRIPSEGGTSSSSDAQPADAKTDGG